ncbi:hypothetical protein BBK36DRAFT_1141549 [Trichoderma citrinoviride]|uniref:HNH nuclease domain-containing protein n=1 Tax=Trichoderma citrinoviride TaxID=58853 RepID=A0A2T4B8E3_9HYPO|nr:hypothetical protein BBK36DRAFT_1141549 [Trichoderma citrinoviride]PTB65594.1 hypothetical protein BBK36DRAFT_1141549 [Trichoderma citrinoviride]
MPSRRAEKPKDHYPRTITLSGGHVSEWQARMRLFESFQRLYQAHSVTSPGVIVTLNATMFAVMMIAPLSQMRRMLEEIRHYRPDQHGSENPVKLLLYAMYTAPEARSVHPAPEKKHTQNVCLFTVSRNAEKADIFPLCTTIGDAFQPLDALLTCFWGERIRDRWASQVTDPRVIESPRNFLSMSRELHFMWDKAAFALKPLSESETEITVQWHWLQKSELSPRMMIPPNAKYEKYVCRHICDSWGSMKHVFGNSPQTGQVFTIRVEDPEQLPSFELLELQWDLLRVAAISGAGNFDAQDPF